MERERDGGCRSGSTAAGHWKVLLSYSVLTEYRGGNCCARAETTKGLPVQQPVFTMAGTLPPTSIPSRLSPTNVELPCVTPLRC